MKQNVYISHFSVPVSFCITQRLDTEVNNVAGDVFVAAACVAYCGAFTNTYRERVGNVFLDSCSHMIACVFS